MADILTLTTQNYLMERPPLFRFDLMNLLAEAIAKKEGADLIHRHPPCVRRKLAPGECE